MNNYFTEEDIKKIINLFSKKHKKDKKVSNEENIYGTFKVETTTPPNTIANLILPDNLSNITTYVYTGTDYTKIK